MKTKSNDTTLVSKLGTTKGRARSRIWLQGNRLLDAGFKQGNTYSAIWSKAKLVLRSDEILDAQLRKVSGKDGAPIIDIVGEQVLQTFGGRTHVAVRFGDGVITITSAR